MLTTFAPVTLAEATLDWPDKFNKKFPNLIILTFAVWRPEWGGWRRRRRKKNFTFQLVWKIINQTGKEKHRVRKKLKPGKGESREATGTAKELAKWQKHFNHMSKGWQVDGAEVSDSKRYKRKESKQICSCLGRNRFESCFFFFFFWMTVTGKRKINFFFSGAFHLAGFTRCLPGATIFSDVRSTRRGLIKGEKRERETETEEQSRGKQKKSVKFDREMAVMAAEWRKQKKKLKKFWNERESSFSHRHLNFLFINSCFFLVGLSATA